MSPDARPLRVVAVSGSLTASSRTTALVEGITAAFASVLTVESHLITLHDLGPHLAGALTRGQLPPEAEEQLQRIENADLLVVATPVYRASFTGLFKHLFDFVDQYALVDTPVLLAATGGSERHALLVEHQMRPLFGFFQSTTLPIGVFGNERDFTKRDGGSDIANVDLELRIDQAVQRALPLIRGGFATAATTDVRRPADF